jgi:HSP20 family protein
MTIVTCRPEKNAGRHSFESAFNSFCDFPAFHFAGKKEFYPRVDVYDSKDKLNMLVEIPGMEKDAVRIVAEDGTLTISGKKKIDEAIKKDALISELREGDFSRSFEISDQIDTEKISADYKNGLLTIELPKKEKAIAREIEVKIK